MQWSIILVEIDSFDALLQAAHEQPDPQRFLLVFVKRVLPRDADEDQIERYEAGLGGGLTPVMYVDKPLEELTSFEDLADESGYMGAKWDMVIVGCLAGAHGHMPTTAEAEEPIQNMIRTIHTGGNLGQFATFDREGLPVLFK